MHSLSSYSELNIGFVGDSVSELLETSSSVLSSLMFKCLVDMNVFDQEQSIYVEGSDTVKSTGERNDIYTTTTPPTTTPDLHIHDVSLMTLNSTTALLANIALALGETAHIERVRLRELGTRHVQHGVSIVSSTASTPEIQGKNNKNGNNATNNSSTTNNANNSSTNVKEKRVTSISMALKRKLSASLSSNPKDLSDTPLTLSSPYLSPPPSQLQYNTNGNINGNTNINGSINDNRNASPIVENINENEIIQRLDRSRKTLREKDNFLLAALVACCQVIFFLSLTSFLFALFLC